MSRARIALVLAAAGLLTLAPGIAPEARAQDAGNPDSFWRASAYLWWANIDGINHLNDVAVTVGDTTSLHASFAGDLQVGKGRFRGIARFSTTSLKNQGAVEGLFNGLEAPKLLSLDPKACDPLSGSLEALSASPS